MAIFVVMGLGDSASSLAQKITAQFPNDHYNIEADKWLVAAPGQTAKDMSRKLGMNNDDKLTGIVVTLAGYDGWASKNIWEWLKVKSVEQPAKT